MNKRRAFMVFKKRLWIFLVCFLCGCGKAGNQEDVNVCNVVLEEGEGFRTDAPVCVAKRGEDAVFELTVEEGCEILGADYEESTLEPVKDGSRMRLTIHQVDYPVVVSLVTRKSDYQICYDANGGRSLDGDPENRVKIPMVKSHIRVNTSTGVKLFTREGYTLIGWNTRADGSGEFVGLGSRVAPSENLTLYAVWSRWTDEDCFEYELSGNYAVITSYDGNETVLSIPKTLDGYEVIGVGERAFSGLSCDTVILPDTIKRVEDGAFYNARFRELYLSDNLSYINDSSFEGCEGPKTLHINAVKPPVYSGSYYDTFSEKYDYLLSVKDEKKLVLFSGSSARFGYDSERLEEAFPEYRVVNMGVFAYTNALPQLLLIGQLMKEGDILLHSPEFDARQRQFCTTNSLDDKFFCMMESNYDAVARLDLRQVENVFNAFYTYLSDRQGMESKGYQLSPKNFDEDGNPVNEESYNVQGDYILYRPNAESVEPVYGLPVEYTVSSFPKEIYFEKANEIYQRFLDKGIYVYLTFSPRNRYALSEDSTAEERKKLQESMEERLIIPVISDIEESLYEGTYLYGTDNHLSTEGVAIRTERIIQDLHRQLQADGIEGAKER